MINPIVAPNKTILINYFWDGLRPSIWTYLDYQRRDLNAWKEVVEKVDDVKTKTNLQSLFYIREIDSKYPKNHCLSGKKDKEDTYEEPCNEASKDKDKAKSHNSSSANQPQTYTPKKDKR